MSDKTFINEEMLLHEMVQTIIKEVSPETIILFGSRDRGDVRTDSDVNLLVVETDPFSPQRSRREEIEHWKNSLNHVVGRAHREGRGLHGLS